METNSTFKQIKNFKKIHFVGIGGTGMYGIAEVLLNLGCNITGSDISKTDVTKRLKYLGVKIFNSHRVSNIKGADLVIYSNAIKKSNPELVYAAAHNIPSIPRAEMLAELMRFKYGIAVAGSHGKSTTTSIISWVLSQCKLDPTYIIGGKLKSSSSHGKLGAGEYLVAEADESDSSFLYLNPQVNIITNIDKEHLDYYHENIINLKNTYTKFINNIPFYGTSFINGDDKNIRSIIKNISRSYITFGLSSSNSFYASNIDYRKTKMYFHINNKDKMFLVKSRIFGDHNILNMLVAYAVCLYLNIPSSKIISALNKFDGISRRFDVYENIKIGNFAPILVNDYGHHPTEIKYTIETIRKKWKNKKIFMIFQPHRYSRTKTCLNEFMNVLSSTDKLILTETYSGGEKRTKYSSKLIHKKLSDLNHQCHYIKNIYDIPAQIKKAISSDDIIVVQGAGNISELIDLLK